MERGGTKSSGASRGSSVVYQRGRDDESLWDDADLIRLWNTQLEQQKEGEAVPQFGRPSTVSSDDGSVISSATGDKSTDTTSSTSSALYTKKHMNSFSPTLGTLNSAPLLQDGLCGLPSDVQRVVLAYYRAGYEAGYFVAKRKEEKSDKKRVKRQRSE